MSDDERPRAFLVRHCESAGQEPDAPLTARGHDQAQALATFLRTAGVARVVSSPWRRARETAVPLAAAVALDERLREWQVPFIASAEWPQALRPIFAGAALPADVEPMTAARARGLAALADAPDGAALVTHGKLLALVLGALRGVDPYDVFLTLENPHVFAVSHDGAVRSLRPALT